MCVFTVFLILFLCLDALIRPIVIKSASMITENELTALINESVNEFLEAEEIDYNDLAVIKLNKNGEISAISANSITVNKIKSGITLNITEKLNSHQKEFIKVPIGNLFNSFLLNGRGFNLKVKLTGYSFVHTDVKSEFKENGINQTLHRIYLTVSLKANTHIGTVTHSEEIKTKILLSETVLVGNVPEVYVE